MNRLAKTTGSCPVPDVKIKRGYRYEKNKFGISGLTPVNSETVMPPRVLECPVQLEAKVIKAHDLSEDDPTLRGRVNSFEVRIQRVHIEEHILMGGEPNRIDPDKWRPLIMSFQHFYGLGPEIHPSRLAEIPEASYRSPDVDHAGTAPLLQAVEEA